MAPRTSSPTALLWAYQLKREHNHLLTRILTLETANSTIQTRMSATESAAQDSLRKAAAVNDLTIRVQAIEEDDRDQQGRFEELSRDRGERFEKLGDGLKGVEKRMRVLETQCRDREDETKERAETVARERKGVVGRIEKLEKDYGKLKEGSAKVEKLQQKDDATSAQILQRRIELLETERKEDGLKVKAVLEKVKMLESELNATKGQLRKALANKGKEPVRTPIKPVDLPRPTPQVASSSPPVIHVPASPLTGRQARRKFHLREQQSNPVKDNHGKTCVSDRTPPPKPAEPEYRTTRSGIPFSQYYNPAPTSLMGWNKRQTVVEAKNPGKKRRAGPLEDVADTVRTSRREKALPQATGNSKQPAPTTARSRGRPRKEKGTVNDQLENIIRETQAVTNLTTAPKLTTEHHATATHDDPVKETEVLVKQVVAPKLTSVLLEKTTHVEGRVRKRPRRRISLDTLPPLEEL